MVMGREKVENQPKAITAPNTTSSIVNTTIVLRRVRGSGASFISCSFENGFELVLKMDCYDNIVASVFREGIHPQITQITITALACI